MRKVMDNYCRQENRFNEHEKTACKNPTSLQANLPLLSASDYDQIVNSMYIEWKDDQGNDDVSSSKEGDNQENYTDSKDDVAMSSVEQSQPDPVSSQAPRQSYSQPNPQAQLQLIRTIIPSASSSTTSYIKPYTVPVISTVMNESATNNDSSQNQAQSKRPNTLILPVKSEQIDDRSVIMNGIVASNGSIQTPSSGFLDSLENSGTGLTPLNIQPSISFLRSITTPLTDTPEGKTFTSM